MKKCPEYTGVNCVNGHCPLAIEHEYGCPQSKLNCDDCWLNEGCSDCYFCDENNTCKLGIDKED